MADKINNSDLRRAAVEAIAAYMHHELLKIGGTQMIPWMKEQGNAIMETIDRDIAKTEALRREKGLIK